MIDMYDHFCNGLSHLRLTWLRHRRVSLCAPAANGQHFSTALGLLPVDRHLLFSDQEDGSLLSCCQSTLSSICQRVFSPEPFHTSWCLRELEHCNFFFFLSFLGLATQWHYHRPCTTKAWPSNLRNKTKLKCFSTYTSGDRKGHVSDLEKCPWPWCRRSRFDRIQGLW